jgi:hypothetical protein
VKGINHLAIVVAVIAHQLLGFLWYSVAPFATTRLEALGKPPTDVNVVDSFALALDVIGWILASYVIAWLIVRLQARSAAQGAGLGFLLWLGLAVPTLVPHYAFAGLTPVVTVIDVLNVLVAAVLTGAILGAWRQS